MTTEYPSTSLPDDATHLLPTLRAGCAAFDVALDPNQVRRLHDYMVLLLGQRGQVNLTGIRDLAQAERLLLLESIAAAIALPILRAPPSGTVALRLLDVGTGGGIPGIPLAITFPHLSVTLIEATRKKVDFLGHAVRSLGLKNVEALWGRAEEQGHVAAHREQYDVVTVRGVGGLATVTELALPFCALDGTLLVYKSSPLDSEIQAAMHAINVLGGSRPRVTPFNLPELPQQHCAVTLSKTADTPQKYPRRDGLPARRPLAVS